jgi:hypothetical protein
VFVCELKKTVVVRHLLMFWFVFVFLNDWHYDEFREHPIEWFQVTLLGKTMVVKIMLNSHKHTTKINDGDPLYITVNVSKTLDHIHCHNTRNTTLIVPVNLLFHSNYFRHSVVGSWKNLPVIVNENGVVNS